MPESDLPGLTAAVLWAAFALASVFGAIAQRTHFCTMGAVADIVNLGDWTRMRMWVLAIGVAMIGFNAMVAAGWIEAANSIYAGPGLLWLSNLVGGLLFGIGMVLASGCGSKTLVRLGGGNLKSLLVLLVLVLLLSLSLFLSLFLLLLLFLFLYMLFLLMLFLLLSLLLLLLLLFLLFLLLLLFIFFLFL